jgi:cell division transport system ATP-binding protein
MTGNPVIEMYNATLSYDKKLILDEVNFVLENGQFCYLIGSTGAGKSSFLKMLYREVIPDDGLIQVAGFDVTKMPESKVPYLRRGLGIVFQDFQLLPDRNVYENIAFAMEVIGANRSEIKQRVLEVLNLVGLGHKRHSMPEELSGGEQQRVVIARALVNEPRLLLADEPTGNLDPEASAGIMDILRQINHRGMAVLMVTHNYDLVRQYPYRTIRLNRGKIEEVSPTQI